jgi:hypothetical protein
MVEVTQEAWEAARTIIKNSELKEAAVRIQRLMDAAEQRGMERAAVIAEGCVGRPLTIAAAIRYYAKEHGDG